VIRTRVGEIHGPPSLLTGAQRQIHIFQVNEEPFVKAAQFLEAAAADHHECAHHMVQVPGLLMIPVGHEVAGKGLREHQVQAERLRQEIPGRRKPG